MSVCTQGSAIHSQGMTSLKIVSSCLADNNVSLGAKGSVLWSGGDAHNVLVLQHSVVYQSAEAAAWVVANSGTIILDQTVISASPATLQAASVCDGVRVSTPNLPRPVQVVLSLSKSQALVYNSTIEAAEIEFLPDSFLVHAATPSLATDPTTRLISQDELYGLGNPQFYFAVLSASGRCRADVELLWRQYSGTIAPMRADAKPVWTSMSLI